MSDNMHYTAEDIRLYLEGKMSPAQMHALEKAALSNPFLADALEGMELQGDHAKFKSDVDELHARLAKRAKYRKGALVSVSSLWWKIAAVLVIVITGIAIITFTGERNKKDANELARTEDKIIQPDSGIKNQSEGIRPQAVTIDSVGQTKKKAVSKQQAPVQRKAQKPPSAAKVSEQALFNKVETESVEKNDRADVQQDAASAKKASAPAAPAADTISRQLEGRAAGINVAGDNDSMFDEVVVVGYGTVKKDIKPKTVSAGRAEKSVTPENGWDEFERYVENNTKINTADSVYKGEEHLSFTISDDGLPESIKILRSISPSHDREAIRLLQNGPSWTVPKGKKRHIRLKIIF